MIGESLFYQAVSRELGQDFLDDVQRVVDLLIVLVLVLDKAREQRSDSDQAQQVGVALGVRPVKTHELSNRVAHETSRKIAGKHGRAQERKPASVYKQSRLRMPGRQE